MNDRRDTLEYLHAFSRALRVLPPAERESIVKEISGHIEARLACGAKSAEVLAGLGSPEVLAAAYVNQDELYRALAAPSSARLLWAVLDRATASATNFLAAVLGISLFSSSLAFLAIALFKMIAPAHVGFWNSASGIAFGIIAAPPAGASEQLGLWIIPLGLIASVLCYLLGRALLQRRTKTLVREVSVLTQF